MTKQNDTLLDAALGVFTRYGFRRTTMGDIAKAAGLSRQALYGRYANKDEVYAAGMELYFGRILETLRTGWDEVASISAAMDLYAEVALYPMFDMLQAHPDASDLIEGANTPEGQAAKGRMVALKIEMVVSLLNPHADTLGESGLTPPQFAQFIETSKEAIMNTAQDRAQLEAQFGVLKASVVRLTGG